MDIGKLSDKYESNGDPGAIGYDDAGGWSYGTNQLATKGGTMGYFLEFLKDGYTSLYKILQDSGGFLGASKGTDQFKAAWAGLANGDKAEEFKSAQYDFVVASYYDRSIQLLQRAKLDLANRTNTLACVVYSVAVMAGPGNVRPGGKGACGLIYDAICKLGGKIPEQDAPLIDQIYACKLERIDSGREYFGVSSLVRNSVRNRIVNEHKDAVEMLTAELNEPSV